MTYNHMEDDHLMDDNHTNFVTVHSANSVQITEPFVLDEDGSPVDMSQGRDQYHQERNNEVMMWTICGVLALFFCYGLYLLFK